MVYLDFVADKPFNKATNNSLGYAVVGLTVPFGDVIVALNSVPVLVPSVTIVPFGELNLAPATKSVAVSAALAAWPLPSCARAIVNEQSAWYCENRANSTGTTGLVSGNEAS